MSVLRTRLDCVLTFVGCVLTIGLFLAVPSTRAEEQRRNSGDDALGQVAPLSRRAYRDVITELPPLKPYKKGATAKAAKHPSNPVESVLESAKQPETAASAPQTTPPAETPTPVAEAPVAAPVAEAPVAAPVAQAPAAVPAEPKPAPIAEAPAVAAPASPAAEKAATASVEAKPAPEAAPIAAVPAPMPAPVADASPVAPVPAVPGEDAKPQPAPAPVAEATPSLPQPAVHATQDAPSKATALDPARLAAIIGEGVKGPAEVRLADRATYTLPAGRVFLPKEKAHELVQAAGHQWDNATIGVVLGAATGSDWIAFIDLLDDGYIKDDGAYRLNAGTLLDAYKASVAAGNEARVRAGVKPLTVTGWVENPHYDEKHRFMSCVGAGSEPIDDSKNGVVNCTSYALGRSGALRVIVATGVEGYAELAGEASNIAEAIAYDPGKGYGEVDLAKDPIAPYGLIALASGSTSVAPEAGAAKRPAAAGGDRLFNLAGIIVGVLGVAALIARRFMSKKPASLAQLRKASSMEAKKQEELSGFLAMMRSKFAKFRSGKSDAEADGQMPAQAHASQEVEPSVSALFKLGALMRRRAEEPSYLAVNADRLARPLRESNRSVLQGGAPDIETMDTVAPNPAAGAMASAEPTHELIEPGAAEGESLRAREQLRVSA